MRFKNLAGLQFGRLTTIRLNGLSSDKCKLWLCRCNCGNEVTVKSASLLSGNTKSCGCFYRKDLTGKQYGRLVVKEMVGRDYKSGQSIWRCLCDCGVEKEVYYSHLISGDTKSCGCFGSEIRAKVNTTHGMTGTPPC